jgi:hypothetical protein
MGTEVRRMSIVKPTLETCFHIDFDWWQKNDRDWHVYLRNYLCKEHQMAFADVDETAQVDWVDPDTAEVERVDGLQHVLITHCARQENFITQQTALIDAIFRIFLANGNQPLNSEELSEMLGRSSQIILRSLSGSRVLQGIRPTAN